MNGGVPECMAMEERGKGGMNEEERMGASKMKGKGECP